MKYSSVLLILCFTFFGNAQTRKIAKNSLKKGAIYGYWGYNRSAYTQSTLHVIGPGYDLRLKNVKASDNPAPIGNVYYNPTTITVPQFNARLGYMINDTWGFSFGYEHMKYVMNDANNVVLKGTVNPGIDSLWSGTYDDVQVTTNRKHFHYENSNGLNYINFQLTKFKKIWHPDKAKWFRLNASFGLGAGFILSYNDFKFAGHNDISNPSISGWGISAHSGLRFEFGKHFFIQPDLNGGLNVQTHVSTRIKEKNSYAKQNYGYGMFGTYFGFIFYITPKNGCGTCPHW